MESFDEHSKINKNYLKNSIKNILNFNEQESNIKFKELIAESLKDNGNIKYIIKIISYYTKNSINNETKNKCYELFVELIKNLSKNDIISHLTKILLYLQENSNNFKIHVLFELILTKFNNDEVEIKIFEILNGFCLINMKNKENTTKKEALLCYQNLIKNYENFDKKYKDKIIKSFLDTMIKILLNNNFFFEDKYLLLLIVNDIICLSKEKNQNHIEIILNYVIECFSLNDNIKIIALNIINNIIKYCSNNINEIKKIINPYLIKLNNDNSINNMIKRIIFDISTNLELNQKENNKPITRIKKSIIKRNSNNKKLINKKESNNNKIINKSLESAKLSQNKAIKNQIFINNKFQINTLTSNTNITNSTNRKKLLLSTFRKEEDFQNPIKMWNDLDINKKKENTLSINFNKSINNNYNIINKSNDELKLDLIMNEIFKISNNQNIIAEKIIKLDKNAKKQISYFEERLNQLENKDINDELINKRCRILYPSNNINNKIINFITIKNNDISIYHLKTITDNEIEFLDNNLIEDAIDKLIFFIKNKMFVEESIIFIKKLFIKNKKKLGVEIIKKLLAAFDILLSSKFKLSDQISFDISLIISTINIEKI